jgi:hypothetical protein
MAIDLSTTPDPAAVYAQMRPDHRTAIAEEFMRVLQLAGDTASPRFRLAPQETLTPEQVATLHVYTREHHPDLFATVMQHPVTRLALASLEAAARTDVRRR